jgi:hypothetical protein
MTLHFEERKKERKNEWKKGGEKRGKNNNFDIVQKLISNQITRHKIA